MAKKKNKTNSQKCLNCVSCWSLILTGVAMGILLVNPLVNPHPVRWAAAAMVIAVGLYWWGERQN